MNPTIRLNDGTVHEVVWCGATGGTLTAMVTDLHTVLEAASAFSDADATAVIVFEYGPGMTETHEGYTRLVSVTIDDDQGGVSVTMRKG